MNDHPVEPYNYPSSTLTGSGDNPVLQVQYNNVEYDSFTRHLWGWLIFYSTISPTIYASVISAYSDEIMMWAQNG
jgi:hypothetical protein